jgi:hypothetical protein
MFLLSYFHVGNYLKKYGQPPFFSCLVMVTQGTFLQATYVVKRKQKRPSRYYVIFYRISLWCIKGMALL